MSEQRRESINKKSKFQGISRELILAATICTSINIRVSSAIQYIILRITIARRGGAGRDGSGWDGTGRDTTQHVYNAILRVQVARSYAMSFCLNSAEKKFH